MRTNVDTTAVAGVADGVRRGAVAVRAVTLPRPVRSEDVAAGDAMASLLAVSGELLDSCARALGNVETLVDVAGADYARTEARAVTRGAARGAAREATTRQGRP